MTEPKNPHAAALGRKGGAARTPRKTAAARANLECAREKLRNLRSAPAQQNVEASSINT